MKSIVDLSLPISPDMPGVEIRTARTLEVDGWNATTLGLYSHSGTHMDAPRHFFPDGSTIDQQPLDACIGPARVVNLAPAQPRQLITPEDFKTSEGSDLRDVIEPNDRLLFRTDWYLRFGSKSYRDELPRISQELAEWLVERRVALIGVEPPSVADVNNLEELTTVHHILLGGNIVIVEGLANLDQLTNEIVEFIALPLNLSGGDGTPVRAIAIQ